MNVGYLANKPIHGFAGHFDMGFDLFLRVEDFLLLD